MLKAGTDYTVTYAANLNVGTALVTITGKGDYQGTQKVKFNITAKPITGSTVTGPANKVYSGKKLTPVVSVKLGGKTLKNGTDYTLTYTNNLNVGKATVKITGKGNYKGTITKTFKVLPVGTSLKKVTAGTKSFTANWTAIKSKMSTSYITGYQIQYSTSPSFATNKKVQTVTGYSRSGGAVKNLTKGTYYVRIRTYKKVNGVNYFSLWSDKMKVTVK